MQKITSFSRYAAVLGLLLVSFGLFSQSERPTRRFAAAGILGMNLAQVDGDSEIGFRKPGIVAGASVAYVLHPRWHLGFEMLFTQRGSSDPTDRNFNNQILNMRFNYVEVPVFIRFQDWKAEDKKGGEYMKIFAQTGISYARLFGGKVVRNDVPVSDELFSRDYKDNDLSIFFGAGMWFTRHIGADFRWTNSIVSFANINNTNAQWHRIITLRGMYNF